MAHYHFDLAFTSDAAQLGTNFGQPSVYYPLQFAFVDGSDSRFNMGPNGGFAGGDTFDVQVYDITSLNGGTPGRRDKEATILLFADSVTGGGSISQLLVSPLPAGGVLTRDGGGLSYNDLSYATGKTAAYGEDLPVYSLSSSNTTQFTLANPPSAVAIKLSFGFIANGRTYIVDPEMAVGRGSGDGGGVVSEV